MMKEAIKDILRRQNQLTVKLCKKQITYNPGKKLLYFYISLVVLHIGVLYAISSIITH